jgi:hypothetical protein
MSFHGFGMLCCLTPKFHEYCDKYCIDYIIYVIWNFPIIINFHFNNLFWVVFLTILILYYFFQNIHFYVFINYFVLLYMCTLFYLLSGDYIFCKSFIPHPRLILMVSTWRHLSLIIHCMFKSYWNYTFSY